MNDIVNGLFEIVGGCLCWMQVKKVIEDKKVAGVYWWVTAFFSAWGFWNLYYYPSLGQWWSFCGGAFLVLGNTAWVCLAIYYIRKQRRNGTISNPQ